MTKKATQRKRQAGEADLDAMIEEATVDAYDEEEQRTGFHAMMEDQIRLPFDTTVLGVTVTVVGLDVTDDGVIVARCRRGAAKQAISVLDLPLPDPRPSGADWIDAYRRWARRL